MLARIDAALDEVRNNALVDGDRVRDMLLDLRAEAQMLDDMVDLACEPWQELVIPDVAD